MSNVTRRHLLSSAAALAGAAALPDGAQAQAQARRILVVASQNDIPGFDPHAASDDATTFLMRNVYDSLVRVDGNPPKVVPHLAKSWTVSADAREYEFRLQDGARFHDGTPVTAEAVKYSIERLSRLGKGNAWMIAGLIEPGAIRTPDPQTVQIRLSKPFAPFIEVLPWIWVVNPAQVDANKGADDGQTYLRSYLAGSGAFKLRRAEPGALYELERVADNWRTGGGNLTGAMWRIIRESASQRLAIQRGEVQVAINLTSDDIDALKGRPGVVTVIEPELRTFCFKLNTQHGPFADINMRKAMAYGFDYKALLDVSGYAKLAQGPFPEGLLGVDGSLAGYATDLGKAREYLAKSKYPQGGAKLVATHIIGHEQQRRWCLVLLDSVQKLGFELDIRPVTWPDMVALTKRPETCPDFFPLFSSGSYADPDDAAFSYHSSRVGNFQNPTFADPAVDALILQGRQETEVEKRRTIYVEIQKRIIEAAPELFGVLPARLLALRSNVQNFHYSPVRPPAVELFDLSLT